MERIKVVLVIICCFLSFLILFWTLDICTVLCTVFQVLISFFGGYGIGYLTQGKKKKNIISIVAMILFFCIVYSISVFWASGLQIIYIIIMILLFVLAVYGVVCLIKDEKKFPKVKKVFRKIIDSIRERFKKEER